MAPLWWWRRTTPPCVVWANDDDDDDDDDAINVKKKMMPPASPGSIDVVSVWYTKRREDFDLLRVHGGVSFGMIISNLQHPSSITNDHGPNGHRLKVKSWNLNFVNLNKIGDTQSLIHKPRDATTQQSFRIGDNKNPNIIHSRTKIETLSGRRCRSHSIKTRPGVWKCYCVKYNSIPTTGRRSRITRLASARTATRTRNIIYDGMIPFFFHLIRPTVCLLV